MAILQSQLSARDELEAEIARLKAENERLRQTGQARLSCKVTDKGGVSVYGLGRFPVTLYRSQWERLIAAAPAIGEFIKANAERLASKE